ncbi:caspase family protein [Streptomyces sp. NPDC006997]|uniref:caspase family protein n=1 Tax=Streptomyces sp. NPDC006997 TaxID=3155356 RepID=UPI0033CA2D7A
MTDRALLVGLDEYPNPANRLNSCVNDTYAFRDVLREYDFTDSDIRILHDRDATLDRVRAELDWLLDGAEPGDRRVFFESSHGYRYLKDGVLVEVLCLYDEFLEDAELSSRTQNIPDGVLTVVLDACHSGGMDKIFVVGNESRLLRMKVFQPGPEEQREKAFAVNSYAASATPVKFFGRAASGNAAQLSKNFATRLVPWPAKGVSAPDVELNAVLLTACRADETAAAGSELTDGLSAFTYALKDQLDQTVTVTALCDRTVSRLKGIGMDQTPSVFAPSDQQFLLSDTFISEQPVTEPTDWWAGLFGNGSAQGGATKSGGFATSAGATPTKTKEHSSMTTTLTPDIHSTIESVLGSIAKSAGAAPTGGGTGTGASQKDLYMADVAMCAANLLPAFVAASQTPTASKPPSRRAPSTTPRVCTTRASGTTSGT